MAHQIRVSPDELRSAAAQYRKLADMIAEAAQTLSTLYNELDDSWDGGASVNALASLSGIRTTTSQYTDGLVNSAETLEAVANAFEKADDGAVAWQIINPRPFLILKGSALKCPRPDFQLILTGPLRIIPDVVRNIAVGCLNVSDQYVDVQNQVQAITNNLQNSWEGNAYNKFVETTADIVAEFDQMKDTIREFAMKIRSAADRYEELDNMF